MFVLQKPVWRHLEQWEWFHQAPSGAAHSASQHQATMALNYICEYLYFISIDFMHLLARCVMEYCFFTWHHFSLWKFSWKCHTFGQQGILNLVSLVNSLEHLWTIQFHRHWQTQGLPYLKQWIVGEGRGSLPGATWEITDPQSEKVFQPIYHGAANSSPFSVMLKEQGLC